jgi:uncharacterized protein with PIN domain
MAKFVADAMLGKLAKWLRILGYDTLYFSCTADKDLVDLASRGGRILLTRNTGLYAKGREKALFVTSNNWVEQLHQVIRAFHLSWDEGIFSRCLICNEPLETASREEVRDLVPPFVFSTRERFARCPECRKVYWEGTHYQRMEKRRSEIRKAQFDSPVI